jgi:hypothetical protein
VNITSPDSPAPSVSEVLSRVPLEAHWAYPAALIMNVLNSLPVFVIVPFDVKPDVSGDKLFNIEVVADNQLVISQPVSVSIGGEGSGGQGSIEDVFGDNWYLWLLGALNVILILIIIIVAIRVASRK